MPIVVSAVLVLALCITFCLSCLAVVLTAAAVLCKFKTQLSLAAELASRMPFREDSFHYGRLAVADQVASGREAAPSALPLGGGSGKPAEPADQAVPMSEGY